jgi:surface antigen
MHMPAPSPSTITTQFGPYGAFIAAEQPPSLELDAGERVGGPVAQRRRRLGRAVICLALVCGGLYAASERREDVTALLLQANAMLQDMQARRLPTAAKDEPEKLSGPLAMPEREIAAAAPLANATPADPPAAVQAPEAAQPAPQVDDREVAAPPVPPQRLPDVVADPKDALQQRALAAGLHPALSRALLDRLSAEDFRNAAHAIREALTQKAGGEPVVWPRRRQGGQAQFRVKLVAGAPSDCRRYVVQIAKDGWETTARPMEKCQTTHAAKPS